MEMEDFQVGGLRCEKSAARHFGMNAKGSDYKGITVSEKTVRSSTDPGDGWNTAWGVLFGGGSASHFERCAAKTGIWQLNRWCRTAGHHSVQQVVSESTQESDQSVNTSNPDNISACSASDVRTNSGFHAKLK